MYANVRYEKPFLKEVVVRVDFSAPIDPLGKSLPNKVAKSAVQHFPISEPRKAFSEELQFSADRIRRTRDEITEWNYHGRDREKRLAISPAFVFATYTRYTTYEDLKADFLSVLESIFKSYPEVGGSRLGLRYINSIEISQGNPFAWSEYIDESLLGLFSRFTDREPLSRLFHIVEFKFDDVNVRFQFGMPNPDYPALIRKPIFVLDLDGYVHGLQNLAEVSENIDRIHAHIQRLFEASITNRLREIMHAR